VQIGTANFAEPVVSARLLDGLPAAVAELGATSMADLIGTLALPQRAPCVPAAGSSSESQHHAT
jgi:dihydroorotate dehydrogenase (NAD+) catalytic subunit